MNTINLISVDLPSRADHLCALLLREVTIAILSVGHYPLKDKQPKPSQVTSKGFG
jgi:hypothetical protein